MKKLGLSYEESINLLIKNLKEKYDKETLNVVVKKQIAVFESEILNLSNSLKMLKFNEKRLVKKDIKYKKKILKRLNSLINES